MSADSQVTEMGGVQVQEEFIEAAPAVLVRCFGWAILGLMVAYIINVILTFWFGMPGIGQLLGWQSNGGGSAFLSVFQMAIYVLFMVLAGLYAVRTPDRTLREDADFVSNMNGFFIRACFWIVLLVGLTDAAISFLRVEGFLEGLVGKELTGDIGRSQFRGLYIHTPVVMLGIVIAALTRTLGFHWLALLVVVAELLIVFSRFVFSYEQAFMADLVRFWYGALFLFASAYTLLDDGHVRVDLLYAGFRHRTKGSVNKWGSVLLGIPLCWTILFVGMWTKSSVIVSPILVFEVTQAGFGLYIKYFMAGFLGIFAISMMVQFVSQFFSAVADSRGESGARAGTHEVM